MNPPCGKTPLAWKPDWARAQANLTRWWDRRGLALCLFAPRRIPLETGEPPPRPGDLRRGWIDPAYRRARAEYDMARTWYASEAFPYFDTQIGPGSLGLFLGAHAGFDEGTVWYIPCIRDPDRFGPLHFDPQSNPYWHEHMGLIDEGLRYANGRYLVGMPDLIENIDTLAALRDTEWLLYDLIERPDWVQDRLAEINQAFFAAFDLIYDKIRDADGGNAFSAFRIWGPGKTAKVQCDAACMLSPEMFQRFVVPHLTAQCRWLDYSMFHLDGTNAMQHLDALLAIEPLDAIEWTPQAGRPGGGSPQWYDLYRRIKRGGKSVQAIGATPDEVLPLLDAVGPEGMFVMTWARDEDEAQRLLERVEKYR